MAKPTDEPDSLQIGWGPARIKAYGPLTVILTLFITLALLNAGMVFYHHMGIGELHQQMIDGMQRLTEAQDETTYIHTLTDAEKRALCLEVPPSLKAKLKSNGSVGRLLKVC